MGFEEREPFARAAGRLLVEALTPASFVKGLGIVALLAAGSWLAQTLPIGPVVLALEGAALALVVARAALPEWATWNEAVEVALRLTALTALVLVPVLLATGRTSGLLTTTLPSGALHAMHPLAAAVLALLPPLFLIVALSVRSFGELFGADAWSHALEGRLEDLALLYAVYFGAVALIWAVGAPVVALAGLAHPRASFVAAVAVQAMAAGVGLSVLGRLAAAFGAPVSAAPARRTAAAPAARRPPASRPELPPAAAPREVPRPLAPVAGAAPATPPRPPAPAASVVDGVSRKPPLVDARERVEAERRRFGEEPEAALESLRALRDGYAVNPIVLNALALLARQAGHEDEAVSVARDAVPIALLKGNVKAAADVVEALVSRVAELALSGEEMLRLAEALEERGREPAAAALLQLEVAGDPADARAVKGLLRLAQAQLDREGDPHEALRLFEWLLAHCPRSPLADFMRQGRAEAERRLSAA